ncbi:MAG TPA: DUF2914 domain-containing protein [Candidatus Polarisedimenticolaceae bacterium]|nr:DUF2914 domain-containing protein [Candidatus Polarisedimenticolaceae bacterium]
MSASEFGDKLRREREDRRTSIEEIAERSKIDLRYLEALEGGDFDALPGPAIGKYYVRVYAEKLGFEPAAWIADYEHAQNLRRLPAIKARRRARREPRRVEAAIARWRAETAARTDPDGSADPPPVEAEFAGVRPQPPDAPVDEPQPIVAAADDCATATSASAGTAEPARRSVTPLATAATLAGVLSIAAWFWWSVQPDSAVSAPGARSAAPALAARVEARPVGSPVPTPRPSVARPAAVDSPRPESRLSVTESGLGRAVERNRLVGAATEFPEGSAAVFLTRVVGGARGDRLRHVWIRDGRTVQTIELPIGGSHWRTHSRKTLYGLGPWTVEAWDARGRVLASVSFRCVAGR